MKSDHPKKSYGGLKLKPKPGLVGCFDGLQLLNLLRRSEILMGARMEGFFFVQCSTAGLFFVRFFRKPLRMAAGMVFAWSSVYRDGSIGFLGAVRYGGSLGIMLI